jgi:hypothetical protein
LINESPKKAPPFRAFAETVETVVINKKCSPSCKEKLCKILPVYSGS